jgi:hypothetical protein
MINNAQEKPKFSIYPRKDRNHSGTATLYFRAQYQFVTHDKSLCIKIELSDWDHKTHTLKNGNPLNKTIKEAFDQCKEKIMGAYYILSQNEAAPTLREIIDLSFADRNKKSYSVLSVFAQFIIDMKKRNTLDSHKSNLIKYNTCYGHLKKFISQELKVSDISFNRINENFIEEFEHYLKTEGKNNHNSAMKMMLIFRRIYRIGLNNRWTSRNAFADKKLTYKDADIEVLTEKEIQLLKAYEPSKHYLIKPKELFLFSVYSGLAYIDLQSIQIKHIELISSSGNYIIRKKRVKTKIEYMVPLFGPLQEQLTKWHPDWENLDPETFIAPRISNQKYNEYLKELTALVGINKRVTTHIGRHTFATTVALENGVGIESVSKMLGHSKIAQTQKYAKVTTLKIERETKGLFEKLKY